MLPHAEELLLMLLLLLELPLAVDAVRFGVGPKAALERGRREVAWVDSGDGGGLLVGVD